MMKCGVAVLFVAAVAFLGSDAVAQVNPYKDPTPGVSGYRAEVLAEVRVQEDKFTRLAEAISAENYRWRPGADVRSIAEVFLHVAAANYNLPKLVGTPPLQGIDGKSLEKSTTDKAKVVSTLKDSFAHLKGAIVKMPDADLDNWCERCGSSELQERTASDGHAIPPAGHIPGARLHLACVTGPRNGGRVRWCRVAPLCPRYC